MLTVIAFCQVLSLTLNFLKQKKVEESSPNPPTLREKFKQHLQEKALEGELMEEKIDWVLEVMNNQENELEED